MGAAERILVRLVPEWQGQFAAKNADYNTDPALGGLEPADVLGVPGQFAEIWRKIWKLKKVMWDGSTLAFEQPREVLLDLIGHCFLAIDMLDRRANEGAPLQKAAAAVDYGNEEESGLSSDLGVAPSCGVNCLPKRHSFEGRCRYRRASLEERRA